MCKLITEAVEAALQCDTEAAATLEGAQEVCSCDEAVALLQGVAQHTQSAFLKGAIAVCLDRHSCSADKQEIRIGGGFNHFA